MTGDLWEEAFACVRRATKVRLQLAQDGSHIGEADRKVLEKLADELDQRAALLKARAAAVPPAQEGRNGRKRMLRSRKTPKT